MKVVHINTYDSGGAAVALFRLHNALLKQGIDSHVLVLERTKATPTKNVHVFNKPADTIWHKALRRFGVRPTKREQQIALLEAHPGDYETYTLPETDNDVAQHPLIASADVICLHWIARFIDYPSFFRSVRKPLVWVFHDMNAFQGGFHYRGDQARYGTEFQSEEQKIKAIKEAAYRQVASVSVVAPSAWMKRTSESSTLTGRFPHEMIHNCGDAEAFFPKERTAALAALDLDPERRYLLFMASNLQVFRKGGDLLEQALALADLPPDVTVLVIGSNGILAHPQVMDMGYVDAEQRLNDLFNASEATLLPSREDNLPNVMVESLLAGTAVIAYAEGGMADVIEHGQNGLLATELSPRAFADQIRMLTDGSVSCASRSSIAEAARVRFDPAKQAAAYVALFQSVVKHD